MSQASTRIVVQADDKASRVFNEIAAQAEKVTKQLEGMGTRVSKALSFFGVGIGGFAVGGLVKDATMAAARYETLGIAMNKAGENAGYSAGQMAEFEKQLQKNGIAMQESRELLARLSAANVDLARSSELARAAQDVAVVAGMDSSQAFEKMVHGAVSAQVEVLRTMGLMVNFESAYARAAAEMGKSAKDLTEAEKLHARLNVTLEAAGKYAGIYEESMASAGKQLGSLKRHVSDLQTLLGSVTLDALAYGVFGVNENLDGLNARLKELKENGTLDEISKSLGGGARTLVSGLDEAAVALGVYVVASRAAQSQTGQLVGALATGNAMVLTRARSSLWLAQVDHSQALAAHEAAKATLAKAAADERAYASAGKSIGITVQQESAFRRLVAAQKVYAASSAQLTATQDALTAA